MVSDPIYYLRIEWSGITAKAFHRHINLGVVGGLVVANAFEEVAESGGRMRQIKFFEGLAATIESNSDAVFGAANIQRNMKFDAHEVASWSVKIAQRISSARLAYLRATVAGIIPSGVTDDAVDEGGISG